MSRHISGKVRVKAGDLIRALGRVGFQPVYGHSSGHYRMSDGVHTVEFRMRSYGTDIRQGTLGLILRRAGLSKDEFLELLK